MNYTKQLSERINSDITKLDFNNEPRNLYDPIRYTLDSGGKRIRPALCIMAAELFGGKYEDVIDAAMGIETFHNFTLIHDDIMDKSLERRGKETVHKKWNTDIAILSGDAMSVLALKFVAKVRNFDILEIFTQTAIEICEGQQYDMDFEKRLDVSEQEYLEMIRLKTSVLLAASLKTGSMLAKASIEECENLYNLGINVGMAFQLQDDFLDTYGDVNTFKKGKLGNDIFSNKKTFLLIKALENASPQLKEELVHWLNIEDFDRDEKFNAVKKIFDNLQVKEDSEKLINDYFKKAEINIDNIG
ncbi:MAG: polyprenyl synthetase family protein, partial [Prevotella sp.]|nr:polyprenyl synthetase family protein [Prevotella sp.]